MIRIVIDTNVLVSAALGNGYPTFILSTAIFNSQISTSVSEAVLEEYNKVAKYNRIQKKHPEYQIKVTEMISAINDVAKVYMPTEFFDIIMDVSDNIFLDLAYCSKAHYLITGNFKDFDFSEFKHTKVVSPKTFYTLYMDGNL